MYTRVLAMLRCPDCGEELESTALVKQPGASEDEISEGLLQCRQDHWFPIVRGVPRMLPDALAQHWPALERPLRLDAPELSQKLATRLGASKLAKVSDPRTCASFSHEWEYHEIGERTWGIELRDRVTSYFLDSDRLSADELRGLVVLDAGCGNGSQSVAYTEFGMEVIAVDLSTGVDKGHAYRTLHQGARPDKVHFVQGDLQRPPLAPGTVDVIHSAGVLHHTPDTLRTFRALRPLLRPGGTFYIWLYKYEPYVTPLVNSIRVVTTRVPPDAFA